MRGFSRVAHRAALSTAPTFPEELAAIFPLVMNEWIDATGDPVTFPAGGSRNVDFAQDEGYVYYWHYEWGMPPLRPRRKVR